MRCAGWSTREFARRSCTAKRWLSASNGATPSSSAGWRRKWNSSPAMSRRCPIQLQRNCARGTQTTRNDFAEPGRRSFRHVYFSTDRRGAQARGDATRALRQLTGKPADAPAADNAGDAFMFQNQYADRSPDQIASIFGSAFAAVSRSGSSRVLARANRVGPGLASRLRTVRHSRARPLVRRNRAADQAGMAR